MSLKNKLNRLKPHLSISTHSEEPKLLSEVTAIEIPFLDKWEQENVTPYFLDGNYCFIREVRYPLAYQHGLYCFDEFRTAVNSWNESEIIHPLSSKGHRVEELFFFDTETTGLGGGVGNTIFILGYASVLGDELILRQHILPNPGAEVPLYQSFLEKVNYRTLVTYNGKSFDWPQVKTRHTLVREHVPKLPAFGHFDLFHAARRLWKHKLDRLKLSIVEKEVLGVERLDDIPGYLAPIIYFDFIESKRPDGMIGILKHNEIDILSLVTLYTHLTFQITGTDRNQSRPETYEVGRWFASLGETEQAKKVLTSLTKEQDITSTKAKLILAYQQKKERNWKLAKELFLEVVESEDLQIRTEACVELSKIFEHRLKDLSKAIRYCQEAINSVTVDPINMHKPIFDQLKTRLRRLEQKYAKYHR
ncbi:ribonuclease H-like domain-containing protein [Neobacillus cucumis]|uniref:ribonuclease H-like domain-containing protein n=1 Tax=Neobacillus cucumis TaxID=1740721 RepID=UPI002040373D|nr:ribonuclease H-like domain-containing protein [Neobacillus cucumis]MCM3724358.1 ribonuclease H-like domain-containing protein [Neobacillus cucumis]